MPSSKVVLVFGILCQLLWSSTGVCRDAAKDKSKNTAIPKAHSEGGGSVGKATSAPAKPVSPVEQPAPVPQQPRPDLQFHCGETIKLVAPDARGFYAINMPTCDSGGESAEYVLHLPKGGPASFVSRNPNPSSEEKEIPYGKLGLALLFAVLFFILLAYVFNSIFILPAMKKIASQAVRSREKEIAPAPSHMQPERNAAGQAQVAQIAQQIRELRDVDLRQLTARIVRLEEEKLASVQPKQARGSEAPVFLPAAPIISEPKQSPHCQFIDSYNTARADSSARTAFIQRYHPKSIQVTNSTDVTRSNMKPLFGWDEDGDLLAVPVRKIDKETQWDETCYYLVPGYERRWVNDRISGGCWNFFFQINTGRGVTALIEPAIVRQNGQSWELAEEASKGEIAWDPNAPV